MAHKKNIFLLLTLLLGQFSISQGQETFWLKMAIPQSGVYQLSAKEISSKGYKLRDIDPSKVEFYSSNGAELPQKIDDLDENKMAQIASTFSGNQKRLKKKDFFLFYAEGSHENFVSLNVHHYDKYNYVFVNLKGASSKQLPVHETSKEITEEVEELLYLKRFETERYNVVNSGREWFGDFIASEYFQNISLDGKTLGKSLLARFRLISTSSTANSIKLFAQNEAFGEIPLNVSFYDRNDSFRRYNRVGNAVEKEFELSIDSQELNLRFELSQSQKSSDGAYLDWLEIEYFKKAEFSKEQWHGQLETEPNVRYKIPTSGSGQIWDVSNPIEAISLSNSDRSFMARNERAKLVFFSEKNAFESPKVENIAMAKPSIAIVPDLIIVSPRSFIKAAESLARYRRTSDTLNAQVVVVEDIYNSYSGGKVDPSAIRNFIRNIWVKEPNKLKYLLLFGDANFDFKNNRELDYVDTKLQVPAYQSRESLEPIYSFSSDDYFGFLQEGLGEWQEGTSINNSYIASSDTTHKLDIGIGRLPVRNLVEAYDAVNKIINYETSKTKLGPWRNVITFVADDGDFNRHLRDAEQFSDQLKVLDSDRNIDKLYLDAFEQKPSDIGVISPEASKSLDRAIERGTMIVNFNGHGSESGWTDEKLLTLDQIFRWKNKHKLPIFFTATCEYGRYDNPARVSGAELSLLDKTNGAIALLTTTRPVFASTNFRINKAFFDELEKPESKRLGDIIKETKNKSIAGVINRNFTLLGDPALKIPKPERKISINDSGENLFLYQQEKAVFEGEIAGENFNGKIHGKFYDQITDLETFGNGSSKTKFEAFDNVIFEGIVDINNGKFRFEFIVPQNTNNGIKEGMAYFYAVNADSTRDFVGKFGKYVILPRLAGTSQDTQGPLLTLNESEEGFLSFEISDISGINLSTVGHDEAIRLIVNDNIKYELKNHYKAIDGFQKGQITFPLVLQGEGQHKIELKLRDVHNNETVESFLIMKRSEQLSLSGQLAFPNPTSDIVSIRFQHNKTGEDLELSTKLFDLNGREIASDKRQCYICDSLLEIGMNLEPFQLSNGTYYYQIIALNLKSGESSKTGGKIIFWN